MQRLGVEGISLGDLHHASEIHHDHAVRDVPHDREIVRDEKKREPVFLLQIFKEIDDLRLDRDVERGDRLVADDERRLHRERARDADALALPARELVRIALGHVIEEPYLRQELGHLCACRLAVRHQAIDQHGLGDDLAHGHARVERAVGILEDDLDLAAIVLQRLPLDARHVDAAEHDLAGGRLLKPQQRAADGGLAATRFPHEADRLAREHVERQPVHRAHQEVLALEQPQPRGHIEIGGEIARLQKRAALVELLRDGRLGRGALQPQPRGSDLRHLSRAQARGIVMRGGLRKRRHLALATVDLRRAARRETAARRGIEEIRGQPLYRFELVSARPVETGHRAQQPRGIGMQGLGEHVLRAALLGQPRRVHDVHAVRIARHDPEVVRDHDERDAEIARKILHELQDLRLDRHIERRRRLVRDDELRIARERDRDHDALAHAARELVRILLEAALRIGNAHQLHELDGTRLRLLLRHAEMDEERLHDLEADRQHRVERCHRLLEDHRDVASPDLAHLVFAEIEQVLPPEQDAARDHSSRRPRKEPHDGERGHRLAATRLADERHDLAGAHPVGDALDRAHDAARRHEVHVKIFDLEQPGTCASQGRGRTLRCGGLIHPPGSLLLVVG